MDIKRKTARFLAAALAVLFVMPMAGCIKPKHIVTGSVWDGEYCYALYDDGTADIIGYTGSEDVLKLPSYYQNRTIVGMSIKTFEDCDELTEVYLPENLLTIPAKLFENCDNLVSVYIPASVETMGKNVVYNCPKFKTVLYGGTPAGWELLNKNSSSIPWSDNYTLVSSEIQYNFHADR